MKFLLCRKYFFGSLFLVIVAFCAKFVAENSVLTSVELIAGVVQDRADGKLVETPDNVRERAMNLARQAGRYRLVSFWLWVVSVIVLMCSIFHREPIDSRVVVVLVIICGLLQFLIV